jgi:hypothetical protein
MGWQNTCASKSSSRQIAPGRQMEQWLRMDQPPNSRRRGHARTAVGFGGGMKNVQAQKEWRGQASAAVCSGAVSCLPPLAVGCPPIQRPGQHVLHQAVLGPRVVVVPLLRLPMLRRGASSAGGSMQRRHGVVARRLVGCWACLLWGGRSRPAEQGGEGIILGAPPCC